MRLKHLAPAPQSIQRAIGPYHENRNELPSVPTVTTLSLTFQLLVRERPALASCRSVLTLARKHLRNSTVGNTIALAKTENGGKNSIKLLSSIKWPVYWLR